MKTGSFRARWQPVIGLLAAIIAMSRVVTSRAELKHVPPAAPSFIVLHSFTDLDGADPVASLLRDGKPVRHHSQ
jgi:hypothetical protein